VKILAVLIALILIGRYAIMPQFRHVHPEDSSRPNRLEPLIAVNFTPLTWQIALQTETPQFFNIRKPRGLIVSNAPESTHAPQETFEPNGIHARDQTAITLGTAYRPYFGNLHSHTGWSDGKGDPAGAFAHARDVGHIDFLAVTDHPEFWLFNSERKWSDLRDIAKVFTSSSFVALAGFEYSSPVFGHYTVINSTGVCSAMRCSRLSEFYEWLGGPEALDAVAFFAHPLQQKDNATAYEFRLFHAHEKAREKIKGIEVVHWGGYRQFLDGFTGNKPFIDEAIEKGWAVGSVSSQDNHGFNWGTGGTNRMVLLMDTLGPESIMEALRSRRFYATSSKHMHFTAQAQRADGSWMQMGEETETASLGGRDITLTARFFEPDVDQIPHRFEWIANGQVIGEFDFFKQQNMREYMDSPLYYAGEFSLTLPRGLLREDRLNYVYARFYQGDAFDAFTQSSPLFFRGAQYVPPLYDGPKEPW